MTGCQSEARPLEHVLRLCDFQAGGINGPRGWLLLEGELCARTQVLKILLLFFSSQ